MAVGALHRLALSAPANVYPVIGEGALAMVEDLSVRPGIVMESSPRHASILLVAGPVRAEDAAAVARLHDQLPHPRASVWWGAAPDPRIGGPVVVDAGADPVPPISAAHSALLDGTRPSETDILPDEPPAPWRGEGDHGQGGKGMMGGTPYGRPMAMTAEDVRDGLALDAYSAPFGPFLPMFPPGLVLDVTLQGDVIQSARLVRPPFAQDGEGGPRQALRHIARLVRLLGLSAQADRLLHTAASQTRGLDPARRHLGFLRWSGAVRAIPAGLGAVGEADVRARLRLWRRVAQGQDAADTADTVAGSGTSARLVDLLPGLEWSEAMLVIASFDNPTLRRMCPVEADDEAGDEDDGGRGDGAGHGGHGDHGGHRGAHAA